MDTTRWDGQERKTRKIQINYYGKEMGRRERDAEMLVSVETIKAHS